MIANNAQPNYLSPRFWGKIILLAILYFVSARLGFLVEFSGEVATIVWPATAMALAVLTLFGPELWPGVALGAIFVAISNNHSPPLLIGATLTHTLEAVAGAWLIRRLPSFDVNLERFEDVQQFILYGVIVSPFIGAVLGVLSFAISPEGQSKNFLDLGWQWWSSHAMSILIITSAVLTWYSNPRGLSAGRRTVELLIVYTILFSVGLLIFIRLPFYSNNLPLGHVIFPFLLWLAIRFRPQQVTGASLVLSIIAMVGTTQSTGPFSRDIGNNINLFLLMTFVVSVMLTALIISAIMTERRQTRTLLQKSHDTLEQRVAERTKALSETNQLLQAEIEERQQTQLELAQARDQALEALRLKEQILANVSHDARTPLNIIMLYADMLQANEFGALTEKQDHAAETILSSSTELLTFFNNLLGEAQLQSEQIQPRLVDVNIKNLITERCQAMRTLAERKGVTLDWEIDEQLPDALAMDAEWIGQIFNNLVDNAIKFTPEGSITVNAFTKGEKEWAIQIKDTGVGIPQDAQERVFDTFWQVDGSATRIVNRGIGLGLSIVKQRLTLLGGSIQVESELGVGSTFTATLPFELDIAQ